MLESLDVKDLDVYRFARSQLEQGYRLLAMAQGLRTLPASRERELLRDHLEQQRLVCLENVLRVLAAQDETGQMRTLWRGLNARDTRQRANSLEALEALVDSSLTKILVPHLEDMPAARRLAAGRKFFPLSLPDSRGPDLYAALRSENPFVRGMAEAFLNHGSPGRAREEGGVAAEISIPDRIVHLKEIEIFEGLSVSELAAVASVAEEMDSAPGEEVIREGEPGETMYLIVSGEVSVLKEREEGQRIELDRIGAGDYFGEMALFEDEVRSATIRTEKPARLLVLHKQEFREIVREYPEIALQICRVLGRRIRRLHEKVRRYEK
ncbi:MAG: cyclic nucleotide-binding domain-containing protein [Deltaproteobacteria bacterium]|nr:cyclic nucleotide-binding domain-containing protein [Deltaproteobacteria bacterium]